MSFLDWIGEHPVLTVVLVVIVGAFVFDYIRLICYRPKRK